jgi:hypothetical protein
MAMCRCDSDRLKGGELTRRGLGLGSGFLNAKKSAEAIVGEDATDVAVSRENRTDRKRNASEVYYPVLSHREAAHPRAER